MDQITKLYLLDVSALHDPRWKEIKEHVVQEDARSRETNDVKKTNDPTRSKVCN